jgi:hypothetical protein
MTPEERASVCLRDLDKCGPEHVRHLIIRHIREAYEDAARIANEHKPPYPREELSQLGRERFDACEAIAASILARTSGETKS